MTLADNTAALQRVLAQVNALPDGKAAAQDALREKAPEQTDKATKN